MKIIDKLLLGALLSTVSPLILACWGPQERAEIDGFSEMEGKLILSFKDAVNCAPVKNAEVSLGSAKFKTNDQGYLELPMTPFENMMDEQLLLSVKKHDYIHLKTELIVSAGTVLNKQFALSRALPPGKIRFVLQWDERPQDLDLHLKSSQFHVSYRHKKYIPNQVKLDRDEMHGFGPETITLDKAKTSEEYNLWVDNYSGSPGFQGKAHVDVYSNNQLFKSIRLASSNHKAMHVLTVKNGDIKVVNRPGSRVP